MWQAVFHGVPLVGIPFSNDQPYNVGRAEDLGVGIAVDTKNITGLAANLLHAVQSILTDDSYRRTALERSFIMRAKRRQPAEISAGACKAEGVSGQA